MKTISRPGVAEDPWKTEGVSSAAEHIREAYLEALRHWRTSITGERAGLSGEFRELAAKWKEDTQFQSSPTLIAMHPSYQRIIGMGRQVLPFILHDLEATNAPWFWALKAITGEEPVRPEDRGYIDRMTRAWIAWGIRKNLV
jgi:hypothetical protein